MYENNSTKQVLLAVLGVAVLVIAVVGVSFAFFTYSKTGNTVNTVNTGTLVFKYEESENGILLENALPMTDADAALLATQGEYFDFSVSSTISGATTISYDILASESTVQSDKDTLDSKYVKLSLNSISEIGAATDGAKVKSDYYDNLTTSAKGKLLLSGTMSTSGNAFYRLRMWMSNLDSSGATTEMVPDVCQVSESNTATTACSTAGSVVSVKGTNGKTFSIKVVVEARNQ